LGGACARPGRPHKFRWLALGYPSRLRLAAISGPGCFRAVLTSPMSSSPSAVLDEIRSVPQRSRGSAKAVPMPPPALAIRIPVRLAGFVLLGLVAVCLVALASWSVDDPSFSYATAKSPANWLGFPGAVIADSLFQVLGLAALLLLVPPALWGWAFARRRMPT